MAFWTDTFLDKMRKEWLRRLIKVQYYAGDTWYDAKITQKYITGNTLTIFSQTSDALTLTITKVRIIDISGDVAGEVSDNVLKDSEHGMLTKWEFPLFELTKEKEAEIAKKYIEENASS